MRLDLPNDAALIAATRRIAFQLDRGVVPSPAHYRSRQRFLGRGERMGLRSTGRLRDLNVTATIIKGEPIYRDDRVAPRRNVLLLVDLSALDDSAASRRLLSVAAVAAGALASVPGARVTVSTVGCDDLVRPFRMESAGDLPVAVRGIEAFASRSPARVNAGKLRFAALEADRRHVVIVTHYLDPDIVAGQAFPLGCTTLLVTPPKSVLSSGSFGFSGGLHALGTASDIEERVEERYSRYAQRMRSRGPSVVIPGRMSPVDAVSAAMAG